MLPNFWANLQILGHVCVFQLIRLAHTLRPIGRRSINYSRTSRTILETELRSTRRPPE